MKKEFWSHMLAYLIIAYSGIYFFYGQIWTKVLFSIGTLLLFIFHKRKFNLPVIWVIVYVISLMFIQSLFWGGKIFTAITYITFMIFIPFALIKHLGYNYQKYIVNVIFFYSVISLIFWTLTNLSSSFHEYLSTLAARLGTDPIDSNSDFSGQPEQFILYTYEKNRAGPFLRNPGPFHEPGAFGVFLIYGIIFNTMISRKVVEKKNIIMFIALLTTFSTAAYLSLIFLMTFSVWVSKLQKASKFGLFIMLIILGVFFYSASDFMGDKISDQFENQMSTSLSTPTSGRILGARKAIYVLTKYPLWGRGLQTSTMADIEDPEGYGYGFMSLAAKIGLIGITIFFIFFYKSLRQFCFFYGFNPLYARFALIAFLFVLFAQMHTESILFFMLFFSSLIDFRFGERTMYNNKDRTALQLKSSKQNNLTKRLL